MGKISNFFVELTSTKTCKSCVHWTPATNNIPSNCDLSKDTETMCDECKKSPYARWEQKENKNIC